MSILKAKLRDISFFLICYLSIPMLLSGCESVAIDSPQPRETSSEELRWCRDLSLNAALIPGQSCKTVVNAEIWINHSGVKVCANQTYKINIPEGQYWYDKSRRSDPTVGDNGTDLMNTFKAWRRIDRKWFLMVAGTVVNNVKPGEDVRNLQALSKSGDDYTNTNEIEYITDVKGELVFFANDVSAPVSKDFFYSNNSGPT